MFPNVSFIDFTLIQFLATIRIPSFHTNFLLSRPHSTLSHQHSTLIYPTAAGKLTTEPRGRAFRRQFLPISQKPTILERPSRIFVKAQERRAPDELLILRPFRFFSILFIFNGLYPAKYLLHLRILSIPESCPVLFSESNPLLCKSLLRPLQSSGSGCSLHRTRLPGPAVHRC